jgi:hypothetical protein
VAIPNHLVDSNIPLRVARRDDPDHAIVNAALAALAEGGAVYRERRRLVFAHSVAGVQVHDARLAAARSVHRVTHLLTLNPDDFKRYTHMTAVYPNHLAYPL